MSTTQQRNPDAAERRATMRAAVARKFGGPEVVQLETVPRPEPGPGQVQVRVRAAGVSVADHRLRSRDLPRGLAIAGPFMIGMLRPNKPILGNDAAGVVEAVGAGVTEYAPGDEVIVMSSGMSMGCHAEYMIVDAAKGICRKPENLTFEEAAALPFGGYTALSFLALVELRRGTEVLVNGGSGAVGSIAVQLAARAGAHVTAVTSARNEELVRSLGAQRVIDYAKTDFAAEGRTYDVIVECVGNAPFRRVAPILRPGGALLLVVGDLPSMLAVKRDSKRSGSLVTFTGRAIPGGEALRTLASLAESGELKPVVDRVYDFDDIVEAHRYVDTGRKRGNVIVRIP